MLSRRLMGAAVGQLKYSYRTARLATGNGVTITFSGVDVGSAGKKRSLVVFVSRTIDGSALSLVTDITVGGKSADTLISGTAPVVSAGRRCRQAVGIFENVGFGSTEDISVTIADAYAGSVCRIYVFEILNGIFLSSGTGQVGGATTNPKITITPSTSSQCVVLAHGWVTSEVATYGWFGSMTDVVSSNVDINNADGSRDLITSASAEPSPNTPTHTVEWGVTGDTLNGRAALISVVFKRG